MKKLETQVNAPAVSAEFPYSRIKDDSGLNDGVPFNESVYGDLHQMLQKMAADSGLTLNDRLDSLITGFQLYEVMRHVPDYVSLYKHGLFDEVLSTLGTTTGAFDKITVGLNRLYISDNSDNDVKSFFFDGTDSLVYDGGAFTGSPTYIQVVESIGRLYVLDATAPAIRVFDLDGGGYLGSEDITTALGTVVAFQVVPTENRIYSVDNGGFIRVHEIDSTNNVPGEEFNIGGGADVFRDIFVLPKKDRIYLLDQTNTQVIVHLISTGAKQAGETFATTITAPVPAFSIIGRKAYILENSPAAVTVWDIDSKTALNAEDPAAADVPNTTRDIFIHSGVMYLLEETANTVTPIKCNAPTEYK